MSDDVCRVLLILIVGQAIAACVGAASLVIHERLEGRRAKLAAYAEMERRFGGK